MEMRSLKQPEPQAPPPKKKKNSAVLIIIAVFIAAGIFITAGWFLYGDRLTGLFKNHTDSVEEVNYFIPVKEFQVNLADPGGRRYLRMRIYFGTSDKDLLKEVEQRDLEIRSGIIAILRCTTVKDLEGKDGMDRLKSEILEQVNSLLSTGKLEEVYFDDFLIQ